MVNKPKFYATSNLTHRNDRMEVALPRSSPNEPAIHKLVDDILEYIFLLNATPPDHELEAEHATTLASSQVCTRWRTIALNCYTIWSLIIDYHRHSLKWIETLLVRSNPSSLDFGSRISSVYLEDGGQDVLELVFNYIHRLRIFNLQVPVSTWELVCSRFLQLPAPNLEFVRVFFIDITGNSGLTLAHPLFDNHAPNLQILGLHQCTIDFTSPVLTSLTELYVHLSEGNTRPTTLDWLNILGGMPSLQWMRLFHAISSGSLNDSDIFPFIHLGALDMLSLDGPFHECVILVKHLITPPRCGLRLRCDHAQLGFDQRQLWAIIEKKIDSWPTNASNRHLIATVRYDFVGIRNILEDNPAWGSKVREYWKQQFPYLLDPVMIIKLHLSNSEETFPLFLSMLALFERTFFDTTYLELRINHDGGAEVFLPLVDSFRGFLNLEKLYVVNESLLKLLFPFLQQGNPVLFPALKSLYFYDVTFFFLQSSDALLFRLVDFLQWRTAQGFPVQKIGIEGSWINRKYILKHIQDTVVEIDDSNCSDWDTEE